MAQGWQPQCVLHTVLMVVVIAAVTALSVGGEVTGSTALLVVLAAAGIGSTGIAGVLSGGSSTVDVIKAESDAKVAEARPAATKPAPVASGVPLS